MRPVSHGSALRWSAVLIASVALSSVPLAVTSSIAVGVIALLGSALVMVASQLPRTIPALAASPSRGIADSTGRSRRNERPARP
jgi:hypothetical protein